MKKRSKRELDTERRLNEARTESNRLAARLRRVEHETDELRIRLDALARHAAHNTPPSIRDQKDLWVVAVEAMSERARHVCAVANGARP